VEETVADEEPQLPPIQVEPSSAPFELPATHKTCPDCEREVPAPGITYPRDPLRPLSEFYLQKAKRYEGGVRYSAYCIPHQRLRNNAYRKAKPKTDQERREHARRQKVWADKSGYEQRPERVAQKKATSRAWHQNNKEHNLERWKRWVAKHPKRRRAQALASYHRRRRARGMGRG
jgi:hypothetical protein